MSGTFPTVFGPSAVVLESDYPSLVSVSQSGRRYTRENGGQRWRLKASFGPLVESEGRAIKAFAVKQRGQWDSFQFVMPHMAPKGVATGTPLVMGASQTGRTIITDGWTASQTGILKAGDILKFAGHGKVYMVVADANSNGTGQATFSIEPALLQSPGDNEALTITSVPFTVAFLRDVQSFPVKPPILYDYEAEMQEVY